MHCRMQHKSQHILQGNRNATTGQFIGHGVLTRVLTRQKHRSSLMPLAVPVHVRANLSVPTGTQMHGDMPFLTFSPPAFPCSSLELGMMSLSPPFRKRLQQLKISYRVAILLQPPSGRASLSSTVTQIFDANCTIDHYDACGFENFSSDVSVLEQKRTSPMSLTPKSCMSLAFSLVRDSHYT